MTRDELQARLSKLLTSQFKEVVFLAKVPPQYLPERASQAECAIDVIRYVEQQNQLDELIRIFNDVVTASGPAVIAPQHQAARTPARRHWILITCAVVLIGSGVAFLATRWLHHFGLRSSDLGNVTQFEPAEVRLHVFEAETRPKDCVQPPIEEDCAESRNPETVNSMHTDVFRLDKKEVTNGDFCAFLNKNMDDWLPLGENGIVVDSHDKAPLLETTLCPGGITIAGDRKAQPRAGAAQRPVTCVTWQGANKYCLSIGKRLPRETEWELAAKGNEGRPFPWGTKPPRKNDVAYALSAPRDVGTSAQDKSPEHIYDLAGNVAEWVDSQTNTPEMAVARGGSFLSDNQCHLLGSKCSRVPRRRFYVNIGFRCAQDVSHYQ